MLWLAGCEIGRDPGFTLPSGPTPVLAGPPAPPTPGPPPRPGFGPLEYTPLTVGEPVRGTVTNPPECLGEPGWPCRYFRLVAPATGNLTVELTYASATQKFQAVDLSARLAGFGGELWSQSWSATGATVVVPVASGDEWYVTMWYTFNNLEFELTTSLKPD